VTVDEIALAADIGKGTVYLHFDSKEEIGIAIIRNYKQNVLAEQIRVAGDTSLSAYERLKQVITLPIAGAHAKAYESPMVIDLINAVRPQITKSITDLMDRELTEIVGIIVAGNESGEMHVANPVETARQMKILSMAYMPGSNVCPMVTDPVQSVTETVELIYQGLR